MTQEADRLFLAVPLTAEVRRALWTHLEALPQPLPGRPVAPESWHLTLRFLGDTPADAARRLTEEMRAALLGPPFTLELGGFGAFPRPARASVLWVGVTGGAPRLEALAAATEAAARRAGFPPERRPFAAHLTLSRVRDPADVRDTLQRLPPFHAPLEVTEVVLFRSQLGRGPARYQALERFALR